MPMAKNFGDYLTFLRDLLSGVRFDTEVQIAGIREGLVGPYLDFSKPLRVLDIANGRLRPQTVILEAQGHRVFGIDIANRPEGGWEGWAYRFANRVFGRQSYRKFGSKGRLRLAAGDVSRLPYPDGYFDLATSVAAFEHFLDVPRVIGETWRVLRPGGVVFCAVHLFTSLSGGHNLEFSLAALDRLPAGAEPWDHLRKRKLPFSVPLNEWRIGQYVAEFSKRFEVLENYCHVQEGRAFLTQEIRAELAVYGEEELLCLSYVIVARKL